MYQNRVIEEQIKKISSEFPVLLLCGSRQVGKSTVLQMVKEADMDYVTLDDLDARVLAIKDPKYFLEQYSCPVLIDEIQYAPELLSYIKIIIDEQRIKCLKEDRKEECLFWLTGSQQFSLMKGVSESLAGRVGVLNLFSLSMAEIDGVQRPLFYPSVDALKKNMKLERVNHTTSEIFSMIYNGGMPSVTIQGVDRNNYFSSYVSTYIERDIRQLANVGKTIEFYNFMQYMAVRTGQEVNYSTISKEIGVEAKVIKNWISILETSGIIYLLQPYSTNLSSRIIKSPKLYFMDTGLCTWLAKWPDEKSLEVGAMSGAIFETYVVSEVIKNFYNHGRDPRGSLFYYRDKDQKEVDLIYCEGESIFPIEIKKGISPNHPDKNFSVLKKYHSKVETGIVICMNDKLVPINQDCWLCPIDLI